MYLHQLDPVLVSLGFLQIRYYSLVYLAGFLLTLWMMLRKRESLGLQKDDCYDLLVYLILGTILGARLFEVVFWEPGYYFSHPLKIIAIWEGGMSYHGGLVGVMIAAWLFCKKKKVDVWKLADIIIVPAALMLAFGRIANFINGELVGRITTASWCVVFSGYEGCRHPQQLYAAAYRFLIFFGLLGVQKLRKKQGFVFWSYVLLEGVGRFVVDFFREDVLYLGLSLGQWISLGMIVVGGWWIWRTYFKSTKK